MGRLGERKSNFGATVGCIGIALGALAGAVAAGLPSDSSKPSYYLFRADKVLEDIQNGRRKFSDARATGLEIQAYFKSAPDLWKKSPRACGALATRELELARAFSIGRSLGQCASQRHLGERIASGSLEQEVHEVSCSGANPARSFDELAQKFSGPVPNRSLAASSQARPVFLELRKQIYLESLANGIKNQLEVGFRFEGYPHTNEMVERVIGNLVERRCRHAALCSQSDKDQIRGQARAHAAKAGFMSGPARTDQQVIDHFCLEFRRDPMVATYFGMKDEQTPRVEKTKKFDPARPDFTPPSRVQQVGSDYFATVRSQQKLQVEMKITEGYRQAALAMMQRGGDGLLMMGGRSGRDFVSPIDCRNPKDPRNIADLKRARENLRNALEEHATRLQSQADPRVSAEVGVRGQLTELVKSNPGAFAQVVGRNPGLASATCDLIAAVEKQDVRQQKVDRALMIGGLVVAGLLVATGVGGVFVGMAATVGGVTVGAIVTGVTYTGAVVAGVSALHHVDEYYRYDRESVAQLDASRSGNGDGKTLSESRENQKKAEESKDSAKMDAVMALTPAAGKLISGATKFGRVGAVAGEAEVLGTESANLGKVASRMNRTTQEILESGKRVGLSSEDVFQIAGECLASASVEKCMESAMRNLAQNKAMHSVGGTAVAGLRKIAGKGSMEVPSGALREVQAVNLRGVASRAKVLAIEPSKLPTSHPLKRQFETMEKGGALFVVLPKGDLAHSCAYVGELSLSGASPRHVIAIREDMFAKDPKVLKDLIDHESGHFKTFTRDGGHRDFASTLTISKNGGELPFQATEVENYSKFAAGDEFRQYSRQGLKTLRAAPETVIQARFKKSAELSLDEVFGGKSQVNVSRQYAQNARAFAQMESRSYKMAGEAVGNSEEGMDAVLSRFHNETGINAGLGYTVEVKSGSYHFVKELKLDSRSFGGLPRDEAALASMKKEYEALRAQARKTAITEQGFEPSDLEDKMITDWLDREATKKANSLFEQKHPWSKGFHDRVRQDMGARASRYASAEKDLGEIIGRLEKLERAGKVSSQEYRDLKAQWARTMREMKAD